jgi:hypothetical protein
VGGRAWGEREGVQGGEGGSEDGEEWQRADARCAWAGGEGRRTTDGGAAADRAGGGWRWAVVRAGRGGPVTKAGGDGGGLRDGFCFRNRMEVGATVGA